MQININDYNYYLPVEHIARFPLESRDQSKLLVYSNGHIAEDIFLNIGEYLPGNCCLVFNKTRVVQARLMFRKDTGAHIEVFCLKPYKPNDYNLSFQAKKRCQWLCTIGNKKKWKAGVLSKTLQVNNQVFKLHAKLLNADENIVEFTWDADVTFSEILEFTGQTPLPPYLQRKAEASDKSNYQTVYAEINGSVAAPTAGLHFTNDVIKTLKAKQIQLSPLVLHVGAGTFKPVSVSNAMEHQMHAEKVIVNTTLLETLLEKHGAVFCVGTTSLRSLESIYWLGVKMQVHKFSPDSPDITQWDYQTLPQDISFKAALQSILKYLYQSEKKYIEFQTSIMITPGYTIRSIKGLITNFHQPKSTLLLLIAALIGEAWKDIYKYALENNFRFLSYGDSSLLFNHQK